LISNELSPFMNGREDRRVTIFQLNICLVSYLIYIPFDSEFDSEQNYKDVFKRQFLKKFEKFTIPSFKGA
jgi:cellobiose-specific phosphotransferase system component IIC